ncbi:MAG: hypothetical protein H0U73_13185 [Tatlockia sp.]|nr:hypothetical protein [Tatlockia sp.]
MKTQLKFLHYLVIVSLIFFSLKSLLPIANTNTLDTTPHYSTMTTDCSSRTPLISHCQLLSYYTLTENEIQTAPYLFILAGSLFFLVIQHSTDSLKSRLFKPPIYLR